MPVYFLFFIFLSYSSFQTDTLSSPFSSTSFPYQMDQPNAVFEMPDNLREISGLSMTEDGNSLAAVNDEEGVIFLLDKETGEVQDSIHFRREGDYEGIEVVGNDAWVVKSNGNLYQVKDYRKADRQVTKYPTFLSKENNVEGLAFDPHSRHLLVACKGRSDNSADSVLKRAIYSFNLEKLTMEAAPAYTLTIPAMRDYLNSAELGEAPGLGDAAGWERYLYSVKKNAMVFSPSGIALHPFTTDIYLLSSKGKMLLVLNREGEILHLVKLRKDIHAQPEGICFDSQGTLYISNEGKKDKARIYKFLYQN